MTAPKWTRPQPTPTIWAQTRRAISDAEHAGDPTYAALILHEAARRLTANHRLWNTVRPALGVRRAVRDEAA